MITNGTKDIKNLWGLLDGNTATDTNNEIPAFFNIEVEDNDKVKEWLETAIPVLETQATDFVRRALENLMFYKGIHEVNSQYQHLQDIHRFFATNKISINICYEFVELWVNRISKYKANISAIPKNNDASAKQNAEAKQLILKDFFEKIKLNTMLNDYSRQNFTIGESYFYASWNPDKGDLDPQYAKLTAKFIDSRPEVETASGKVIIDRKPRIGDVDVKIIPAINVLFEDRVWTDVEYVIIRLKTNIDKLRSDYTDIELKGSGDVDEYHMYHLPTKYLQEGRFIKYACGEILENTKFPYAKPILPVVRISNIDVVGASRAKSFLEMIKPYQVLINETITTVWNNLRRSAKGKWVYQAKTVNEKHLAPESPGIGFYGAQRPEFIAYPGIKQEALNFIELIRTAAEKIARIQSIAQGTPPPNVRSGMQMAQLEEQQQAAVEIDITKRNDAIIELANVVTMIMAKFYKENDGRMVTVLGRDKEYLVQSLSLDALKTDHIITIKNDDFMPVGKATQLSMFADLAQQFGADMVPREMIADLISSGKTEPYFDFAGATVETTNSQIEMILKGEDAGAPMEYEDLLVKWKIMVGHMRKRSFMSLDKSTQEVFADFVLAIETLLMDKVSNPIMQEQISMLPGFPIYYKPPSSQYAEDMMPPQGAMPPAGAPVEGEAPVEPAPEDGAVPPEMQ